MSKTLTTLLAGAALLFTAGAAAAFAPDAAQDRAEAARQAAEDARAAAEEARDRADEAREKARAARDHARREVRIYRGDADGGVYVFHGGDRAEHLRTILQLRPDQETALKTYLDAVNAKQVWNRDFGWRHDKDDARTTPERLAEMEQRMAEQQAAMRRRIDATKAFYGQLDEKQRKVFDALPMLMFSGPGFGPMLMPILHTPEPPAPPVPPKPPAPPRGL